MSKSMIVLLDYGVGNLRSLSNAFSHLGFSSRISENSQEIMDADLLVIPGVGAFGVGIQNIFSRNLHVDILRFIALKKPVLGICLGMQLLFSMSEEFGIHQGLSIIKGKVLKIPVSAGGKLPHVGWSKIRIAGAHKNDFLMKNMDGKKQYFLHSYHVIPEDESTVIAYTECSGGKLVAAVKSDNVYGLQFHPEKSGVHGLALLKHFVSYTQSEVNPRTVV